MARLKVHHPDGPQTDWNGGKSMTCQGWAQHLEFWGNPTHQEGTILHYGVLPMARLHRSGRKFCPDVQSRLQNLREWLHSPVTMISILGVYASLVAPLGRV